MHILVTYKTVYYDDCRSGLLSQTERSVATALDELRAVCGLQQLHFAKDYTRHQAPARFYKRGYRLTS